MKSPVVTLLAALLLLAGCTLPSHAAKKPRPNVLLIVIDDLNDWIGCLGGHPQALTPNMDRLARQGTLFTNAHCQAPLCNPSRTSFLTGLRPSTTGVYGLDPWFRTDRKLRNLVTLPQYFERHGYRTLTTGKIFHDAYPPREQRTDGNEFSRWGFQGGYGPLRKEKFVKTPMDHPAVDWGVYPERDEDQDDWKVADWAVEQLKQPQGQPFFLSVGFRRPHLPCYASQKWFDLYPEEKLQLPAIREGDRMDTPRFSWYLHWLLPEPRLAWLRRTGQWKPLVRAYLASTSFVDSQVGRVLQALRESGQAENTVVALVSDHGWHLGEKEISGKNSLWEPSTRVPMMIAAPGRPGGARCGRPVELVDLYPTLIDLCRLPGKDDLDGRSVTPLLEKPDGRWPWPAITTHGPDNHAVRTERWRYIRYADGSEELYDLVRDPREWNNLADRPRLESVRRELARWLPNESRAPIEGSKTRLIEKRKGSWYWEGKRIDPKDPVPMDD